MSIIGERIGDCYDAIGVGDHIRVECNSSRGQSWLTGKVKEVQVIERVIRYPLIKLESGWCINQDDMVVEHKPVEDLIAEEDAERERQDGGQFGLGA